MKVIALSARDLGFPEGASFEQICEAAKAKGCRIPPGIKINQTWSGIGGPGPRSVYNAFPDEQALPFVNLSEDGTTLIVTVGTTRKGAL